jgi:hypothetical protein
MIKLILKLILDEDRLELFFYWINERHRIWQKKELGQPWPWTDDTILQEYKFTNWNREFDAGTVWLRENWLKPYADHPELFFNIVLYRHFNWIGTAEVIGFTEDWNPGKVEAKLRGMRDRKERVYTNAHMLGMTPSGADRITYSMNGVLTPLWDNIEDYEPQPGDTLQSMFKRMKKAKGFGEFLSYEVVTDLRHTRYLNNASDIMTWANPGPGAQRGINRLYGITPGPSANGVKKLFPLEEYVDEMRWLLSIAPEYLIDDVLDVGLEMRDIEHSLCEFDKYMRVKLGEGRPRVKYKPPHLR